jgi:hypothetical protein
MENKAAWQPSIDKLLNAIKYTITTLNLRPFALIHAVLAFG